MKEVTSTGTAEMVAWAELHIKILEQISKPLKEKPKFYFSGFSLQGELEKIGSLPVLTRVVKI